MFKGGKIPEFEHIEISPDVFRAVELTDYTPPIRVIEHEMETKIEDEIYNAVIKVDIQVSKEDLIKALRNDRNQYAEGYLSGYSKGYADGKQEFNYETFQSGYFMGLIYSETTGRYILSKSSEQEEEQEEFFRSVEKLYNKLKEARDEIHTEKEQVP